MLWGKGIMRVSSNGGQPEPLVIAKTMNRWKDPRCCPAAKPSCLR